MEVAERFLPFTIICALLFAGCRKEKPVNEGPSSVNSAFFGNATQLSVGGRVVDEQGVAIEGAVVTEGFGHLTTVTDANGIFRLNGIAGYADLGYVKVSKPGFFGASRSFRPVPGTNSVRVTLLARNTIGTIQASSGGTLSAEGVVITLPAATYTRNGVPYTGSIAVALNYIDPSAEAMVDEMPGALLGVAAGEARLLRSFGMVAVELSDPSGVEVEIADGTANVEFPIPLSMQGEAPPTIDLWHFDESSGVWARQGEAQLQSGRYVAEVGHFSWWNCDIPSSFVQLDGQLQDAVTLLPISGARVSVQSAFAGTGITYTNDQGHFGGLVPHAQALTVVVSIPCGQGNYEQVYQETLASLSQAQFMSVSITSASMSTVQGTLVDCAGNPVESGYVMAGPMVQFCSNGQFSLHTCLGNVDVFGVDQATFAASVSQSLSLSGGLINLGDVTVCDNPNASGGVTDIEGNNYATIMIGAQEWMAENLRTAHYANGDPIPIVNEHPVWVTLSTGAATWVNTLEDEFGKLYNWFAVTDPRNVCPSGWHVPSDSEWKQLELTLGMSVAELDQTGPRGENANVGGKMKVVDGWNGSNATATNESGFTALPGGYSTVNGGPAVLVLVSANFWSASEMATNEAWCRNLYGYFPTIYRPDEDSDSSDKRNGLSVRCVRN